MASKIFLGSLIVCVLSTGLSQIPDPAILGIRDEPSTIMFYGGLGLLAAFSGLLTLGSGGYLGITRLVSLADRHRRLLLSLLLVLIGAAVAAGIARFFPT